MAKCKWIVLGAAALLAACSADGSSTSEDMASDAGTGSDSAVTGTCSREGTGSLAVEISLDAGVLADVRIADSMGSPAAGGTLTATRTVELAAGEYSVSAHRVRASGPIVGPAYQGSVEGGTTLCVRNGETTKVRVVYTREPGSEKLWLTNGNGEGQILAFGSEALAAGGEAMPAVTLDGKLTSPSALRFDARGRLWVGDRTGKLVAFATDRLGASSSSGPDVVLEGDALCGKTLPCGPRAMAFDREGALWVATLERIVKLAPESLESSGEPTPELSITSPDVKRPMSLAFDAAGNLWAGDDESSAVAQFAAARLTSDIANGNADVVLLAQTPPPVVGNLRGPEGLAFDRDDNLWVGYFAGNNLAKLTPEERAASATLTPKTQFDIDVLALVTDLAIDEAGNLWMPGAKGAVYRIDAAELANPKPALVAVKSGAIGNAEKIALHSVPGALFIAP